MTYRYRMPGVRQNLRPSAVTAHDGLTVRERTLLAKAHSTAEGTTMARSDKQRDYYQRFADDIIQRIKDGTAPWQKPWKPGESRLPENMGSGRPYTGGNSLYLAVAADRRGYADNRWATYRQIKAAGGHVRKGETGEQVVFFARDRRVVKRGEDGKPKRGPDGKSIYDTRQLKRAVWRTFTVFNAEQTAGLELGRETTPRPAWHPHRIAEAVLAKAGVPIDHKEGNRAFYHLKNDRIVLPERTQFPSADNYYQTALHELAHSTGHPSRMNRETLVDGIGKGFGSPDYAREELRAEISAMMTADRLGTGHDPDRGAAYVEGWVTALEEDPREIHRAAAEAQRMSNYVIEPARKRIGEIERDIVDRSQAMRPDLAQGRAPGKERITPIQPTPAAPARDDLQPTR